jgi:hypothetical protein
MQTMQGACRQILLADHLEQARVAQVIGTGGGLSFLLLGRTPRPSALPPLL